MKNAISKTIRERKSTFPINFEIDQKIDDAIIEEILDLAVWAPTHKETQPWRFMVFEGEGIQKFFDKQSEIYQATTPPEKFNKFKLKKYEDKAKQVSHVVVVIAEHHTNHPIPEVEELVAASCVVENMYLLLSSYGIGGYLSTGKLCYEPLMRNFLQLQPGEKVIGFFQMGIPKKDIKPYERTRIPAKDKTQWIR